MSKNINRRDFLKTSATLGAVSFISHQSLTLPLLADEKTNSPDITVVEGKNYFVNTIISVDKLGGIDQFIKKDQTVGLLINSPWKNPGSYTNPDVALAVLKMCIDAEAGEIFCLNKTDESYWKRSKLYEKYAKKIIQLKQGSTHQVTEIKKGIVLKKAEVIKELFNCDVFINIPVAKHHQGTNFTGNLKNLMGVCPYSTNRYLHSPTGDYGYEDVEHLSQAIADLNLIRKPDLCVVDATEFITSNGPAGPGNLSKLQKVVAGTDPVAVDAFCATLTGRKISEILMLEKARKHGLGVTNLSILKIKEFNA